jgi:hypothetical protein
MNILDFILSRPHPSPVHVCCYQSSPVMGSPLMSTVISALLAFVTTLFRPRESLRLGHLALRHQLSVYKQTVHVRLLVLELSEDELTVLAAALTTLLKERDDRALEAQAGASRDEVEAILQDLHAFLKQSARQSMTS